jgi:hypothetical protein
MKFEDFKSVVLKAVKLRQDADYAVAQARLDFDLKELTADQLGQLVKLVDQADTFTWKGISAITSEKWDRENDARKAREAAEEAADQAKNDDDKRQAYEEEAV